MISKKNLVRLAAVSGLLSVGLGAFGAHALKPRLLELGTLSSWETAAHYHLIHSVAMLLPLCMRGKWPATLFFGVGIIFFSGSLYLLAITKITVLGAITPLGGLCFLAGWLRLVLGADDSAAEVTH